MKEIARYSSRHAAELAAGFLKDAGIGAIVRSDDASGWEPGLTFVQAVRILVDAEDEDNARTILQDLEGPER